MKPEMRRQCVSSRATAFNIASHLLTISSGHATIYSSHFLCTRNKMKKEQKWEKRGKTRVQINVSSQRQCYYVTLSLCHSLTMTCSEYVHVCVYSRVCVHTCVSHKCVCVCVFTGTFPYACASVCCRAPIKASCLPSHTFICRLACGCLPARVQERGEYTHFPAAFVELCYLLTLSQLLSNTLISSNKGWYCSSHARKAFSQAIKANNYSQSCFYNKFRCCWICGIKFQSELTVYLLKWK